MVPASAIGAPQLFSADGEHTIVRLVHRDLPSEDSAGAPGGGWDHYLDRLAVVGAGPDASPDPWAETGRR